MRRDSPFTPELEKQGIVAGYHKHISIAVDGPDLESPNFQPSSRRHPRYLPPLDQRRDLLLTNNSPWGSTFNPRCPHHSPKVIRILVRGNAFHSCKGTSKDQQKSQWHQTNQANQNSTIKPLRTKLPQDLQLTKVGYGARFGSTYTKVGYDLYAESKQGNKLSKIDLNRGQDLLI